MLDFEISLPVLAMTGGIILLLVALRTVLQQSGPPAPLTEPGQLPDLGLALTPLAFPTIVTPYGIAAVIVFATLAGGRQAEGLTVVLAVVLGVTQAALGLQIILHSLGMIVR